MHAHTRPLPLPPPRAGLQHATDSSCAEATRGLWCISFQFLKLVDQPENKDERRCGAWGPESCSSVAYFYLFILIHYCYRYCYHYCYCDYHSHHHNFYPHSCYYHYYHHNFIIITAIIIIIFITITNSNLLFVIMINKRITSFHFIFLLQAWLHNRPNISTSTSAPLPPPPRL